ncbi:MAG: glycosyltransferase family 4 protein [Candidatus Competibacteraceae bacterium]|nr:glycosyltransferase family 4 protein [Candidatus Competibacteraceae bacterium]
MVTAINGRFVGQQISGVQTYARRFTSYLLSQNLSCKVFSPIDTDPKNHIPVTQTGMLKGHPWEQFSLPNTLRNHQSPLLLNFCNTAPLSYSRQIITIHDLAFVYHPKSFHPLFTAYYKWLIPRILRKALAIITVSTQTANELQLHYRVNANRIHIIYNTATIHQLSSKTRNDFILSVGSIQPRKDYVTLYNAYIQSNTTRKWIIVGSLSDSFSIDKKLWQTLQQHPLIEIRENISEEELDTLYATCAMLISGSYYEGCNLPVLEAVQAGCPVIATDIPVHRELYKNSIQYFKPGDAHTLSALINTSPTASNNYFPDYTIEKQGPKLMKLIHAL